jgi:hypothetical protein
VHTIICGLIGLLVRGPFRGAFLGVFPAGRFLSWRPTWEFIGKLVGRRLGRLGTLGYGVQICIYALYRISSQGLLSPAGNADKHAGQVKQAAYFIERLGFRKQGHGTKGNRLRPAVIFEIYQCGIPLHGPTSNTDASVVDMGISTTRALTDIYMLVHLVIGFSSHTLSASLSLGGLFTYVRLEERVWDFVFIGGEGDR